MWFCILYSVSNQLLMRFGIKAFTFSATIHLNTVLNSQFTQFAAQNCNKPHFPANFQLPTNRNILIIDPYLCLMLTRLPKKKNVHDSFSNSLNPNVCLVGFNIFISVRESNNSWNMQRREMKTNEQKKNKKKKNAEEIMN